MSAADDDISGECGRRLAELGLSRLAKRVRVGWNSRLRSTAGRARPDDAAIELNPRLAELGADEVRRTLLHELAHLVAYERHGRRIAPHGPEWRRACAELGISGEKACHDLPLPRHRQRRRYYYECRHCREGVERVRRMRRHAACAACCRRYAGGRFDQRFLLEEKAR